MNWESAVVGFLGAVAGGAIGAFAAMTYLGYVSRRLETEKVKAAIRKVANASSHWPTPEAHNPEWNPEWN